MADPKVRVRIEGDSSSLSDAIGTAKARIKEIGVATNELSRQLQAGKISLDQWRVGMANLQKEAKGLNTVIKKAGTEASTARSSFGGLGGALSSLLTPLTASVLGFAAAGRAVTSWVTAANESETATAKLTQTFASLGSVGAAEAVKALNEQADALQKVTQYDDEAITSGQALIGTFTKNVEVVKAATQAAVDFAAKTGTPIEAAFKKVAQAAGGSREAFARWGIKVDENLSKTEALDSIITQLGNTMGGAATAQADTFAGRLTILKNQYGELQEKLGGFVAALATQTGAINGLNVALDFWNEKLTGVKAGMDGLVISQQTLDALDAQIIEKKKAMAIELGLEAGAIGAVRVAIGELVNGSKESQIMQADLLDLEQKRTAVATQLAAATNQEATEQRGLGEALDTTGGAYKNATEAALGLGKALGLVTSIELEQKIADINEGLAESKAALGENSQEYERLAEAAAKAIEETQRRIDSLKAGQGDLVGSTERVGSAFTGMAGQAARAARDLEKYGSAARDAAAANQELADSASKAGGGLGGVGSGSPTDREDEPDPASEHEASGEWFKPASQRGGKIGNVTDKGFGNRSSSFPRQPTFGGRGAWDTAAAEAKRLARMEVQVQTSINGTAGRSGGIVTNNVGAVSATVSAQKAAATSSALVATRKEVSLASFYGGSIPNGMGY